LNTPGTLADDMGLALRYNVFSGVQARAVYGALARTWAAHGHRLEARVARTPALRARDEYVLYQERDGWTLLDWDGGWEWTRRREAQLDLSRALGCAGLLVFVYDGQSWGYELFDRGQAVDHYLSDPAHDWFPGWDCSGDPDIVAASLPGPGPRPDDVAEVLGRRTRPAGHGALAFLDLLGVRLRVGESDEPWWYVAPEAPAWRAFAVVPADAG
jgi:hypothetical protein